MSISRRSFLSLSAVAALSLTVAAGCTPAGPRAPTGEELDLLLVARFNLFQRGQIPASFIVPGSPEPSESDAQGQLDMDYTAGVGFGNLSIGSEQLNVAFDKTRISTAPAPPDGSLNSDYQLWNGRDSDSSRGDIDIFTILLCDLGLDRPENAQLLGQQGVLVMGTDRVNGIPVTIFSGPQAATDNSGSAAPSERVSRDRFWIDTNGQLLRFQAYLRQPSRPASVDFDFVAPKPEPMPEVVSVALLKTSPV